MVIERLRSRVSRHLDSIGRRIPIPADAVTVASPIATCAMVFAALYLGNKPLYFLAIIVGGLLDVLDGAVARARGSASPAGAFLDSVSDRFVDAVIMIPLAWIADGATAVVAVAGSLTISYVRARAESLCIEMRGVGFMERGERIVVLAIVAFTWILDEWMAALVARAFAALLITAAVHRAWAAYVLLRRREGGCSQSLAGKGG